MGVLSSQTKDVGLGVGIQLPVKRRSSGVVKATDSMASKNHVGFNQTSASLKLPYVQHTFYAPHK